jgi:hypothetical protein
MEKYYKEFGIFNDNFNAINEYTINDKLAIDENNNITVQHPYFFRWIHRKFKKQNNVTLILYLESHINKYINYLENNYVIYENYNDKYQLIILHHTLLHKLISGLYRLKDYYCAKKLFNRHLYIKNIQDLIEKLSIQYNKITNIINKNDDEILLDIYLKK